MTNPMMRQKSRPRLAGQAALLVGAALLTGCVSWETTYPTATPTLTGDTGPEAALDEAERLANDAGNRALLEEAISAYEAIVEKRPANFRALSQLGQLTILLGAAYTEDAAEKGRLYKLAGDYNAAALYTNPEFRRLVDGGATLADATRVLGEREMNPMGFWCQSVFYFFKERLGTLGRIRNFAWIQEAQRVLTRMEEIDPDWRSGGIPFSFALVNIALPPSAGGDKAKAKELIDSAVANNPNMIRNRWGRAKYYHSALGTDEAFWEDLSWVLQQDPRQGGPYAWNVYFQADARRLLAEIDPAP
jgi:tetratricopeptide (TPR) repeat protein